VSGCEWESELVFQLEYWSECQLASGSGYALGYWLAYGSEYASGYGSESA